MKCPKCGFEQPDDIYCANCGIEVTSYARSRSRRNVKFLAIAAILLISVSIVLIMIFVGGEDSTGISEPLSMDDASDAYNTAGEDEEEFFEPPEPPEKPPEPRAHTLPREASKPVPPTVQEATMRDAKGLIRILVGPLGGRRDEFRLMSVKNGLMTDVVFQLDNELDLEKYETVQRGDSIFAPAAEGGDRDDQLAASRNGEDVRVVEVTGWRGGKAWFYLYREHVSESSDKAEFVHFSKTPERVSTEFYVTAFNSESPNLLDELNISGLNLIDRLKIRLYTEELEVDENVMAVEADSLAQGPLIVRSRWDGSIPVGDEDVTFTRESEYFPDHFEIGYTFDFPPQGIRDGILRIYLDLSDNASGLKVVTSDQLEGELVDGHGTEGEHRGNWFIIAGAEKALRVTLTKGSGKLIIMDDDSMEDPPESETGCLGCCGYEFSNIKGILRTHMTFEILDWKVGDNLPPANSTLKAMIYPLE